MPSNLNILRVHIPTISSLHLLALVLLSCLINGNATGINILLNSNFEDRSTWIKVGDAGFTYSNINDNTTSARVIVSKDYNTHSGGVSQGVNISAADAGYLIVSAWVYATDSAFPFSLSQQDLALHVWTQHKHNTWSYKWIGFRPVRNKWTQAIVRVPVQSQLHFARVECIFRNHKGTIYFDDVTAKLEWPLKATKKSTTTHTRTMLVSPESINDDYDNNSKGLLEHAHKKKPQAVKARHATNNLYVRKTKSHKTKTDTHPSPTLVAQVSSHHTSIRTTRKLVSHHHTHATTSHPIATTKNISIADTKQKNSSEHLTLFNKVPLNTTTTKTSTEKNSPDIKYVFIGLSICVLLVIPVGGAIWYRHRKKQNKKPKSIDDAMTRQEALARSEEERAAQTGDLVNVLDRWTEQLQTKGGKMNETQQELPYQNIDIAGYHSNNRNSVTLHDYLHQSVQADVPTQSLLNGFYRHSWYNGDYRNPHPYMSVKAKERDSSIYGNNKPVTGHGQYQGYLSILRDQRQKPNRQAHRKA